MCVADPSVRAASKTRPGSVRRCGKTSDRGDRANVVMEATLGAIHGRSSAASPNVFMGHPMSRHGWHTRPVPQISPRETMDLDFLANFGSLLRSRSQRSKVREQK